jgi:crotonobetainyl-CoA:carnitine CoA-transferase CaiB-like acyl-CoA transferase
VRDDADLSQLVAAMGRPNLLDVETGHDVFDEIVAGWTRTRTPAAIIETLRAHNIPVEQLISADRMYDIAQVDDRGCYEQFEHPITGPRRCPGWPFRIIPGPARHHRTAPPTLDQHNDEILCGLVVSEQELAALRDDRVIGERVLNA